jgi:hypothetical protein
VLTPKIPSDILQTSRDFSRDVVRKGGDLKADWLNNGPESLTEALPKNCRLRLQGLYSGRALHLQTLGRADLLCSKLFAYCDRQQDLADCVALQPLRQEILESLRWLKRQDAHSGWPEHVDRSMAALARRLGYEL